MHNGFWQQASLLTATEKQIPLKTTKLVMSETCDEGEAERVVVSDEAAMVVSKMCELFVRYVSAQAGVFARRSARRSVRDDDVVMVFLTDHVFDFCIDIARFDPNERLKRFPPAADSAVEKSIEPPALQQQTDQFTPPLQGPRGSTVFSSIPPPLSHVLPPAMLTLVRPQRPRKAPSRVTNDDPNNNNNTNANNANGAPQQQQQQQQ